MEKLSKAITIVLAIGALMSMTIGAHCYFAKQSEFAGFQREYRIDQLSRWVYQLEDRYRCSEIRPNAPPCFDRMSQFEYDQYRRWIEELKALTGHRG